MDCRWKMLILVMENVALVPITNFFCANGKFFNLFSISSVWKFVCFSIDFRCVPYSHLFGLFGIVCFVVLSKVFSFTQEEWTVVNPIWSFVFSLFYFFVSLVPLLPKWYNSFTLYPYVLLSKLSSCTKNLSSQQILRI